MSADLTDLSRRVAVTGRWSPRLGTVVVMGDGTRFRVVREGYAWSRVLADAPHEEYESDNDGCVNVTPLFDAYPDERPDLDDEVTALSLLADLPGFRVASFRGDTRWQCWSNSFDAPTGATRAEAIVLAWLAVLGR